MERERAAEARLDWRDLHGGGGAEAAMPACCKVGDKENEVAGFFFLRFRRRGIS